LAVEVLAEKVGVLGWAGERSAGVDPVTGAGVVELAELVEGGEDSGAVFFWEAAKFLRVQVGEETPHEGVC